MRHISRIERLSRIGRWQRFALGGAFLAVLALGGCGPSASKLEDAARAGVDESEIVARVNGRPVYNEDILVEAVGRGIIREGEELDQKSDVYYQLLQDLIDTKLLALEAETRRLDRTADARRRLDIARERILASVLNEDVATKAIKESAIQRMYRQQIELLGEGREIRARRIVLASEDAALAAKRRLETGESFEALAYEISIDRVTAADGGDLGFFLLESMPDPLRGALQDARVKQILGPLKTDEGWQILRIDERRETSPPSLDLLRPKIVEWLMFDEQRQLVEKLRRSARIEQLVESTPSVGAPGTGTADSAAPTEPEASPSQAAPGRASGAGPTGDSPPAQEGAAGRARPTPAPEQLTRPVERET